MPNCLQGPAPLILILENPMKNVLRILAGSAAAALMTFSLGCQPPKPPAPAADSSEPAATVTSNTSGSNTTSNMTGNTTTASETPVGETP
ncbi:hypothetical protein TBK1r_57760 [Stieleria magnilauensis]|uniref:Uncharacterized protein n=2 Tax=Pirellulaceae TaxID=2691357 RepID=A0ABX5XYB9_9BACT|nr:hypothetical protein TBK1r_57760 [Planctomycetes bacterium TBK1r]